MNLPTIEDLFQNLHPVLAKFLACLTSPYEYWYEVAAAGAVDEARTRLKFRAIQKELGDDELAGMLPIMRWQPVKGSEGYMLARAFDRELHELHDIKNEEEFRARRRSLGTNHGDVRGLGSALLYGGFENDFDERSMIRGPFYAGRKCVIRNSAKVIGPALAGDETLFNANSVFTRSVMGNDSQIDDHVVAKDTLIGSGCYLMAGVECAHRNGRNGDPIVVRDMRLADPEEAKPMTLARHKMGCVIGDGCTIEGKVLLHPGTVIMPGTRVWGGMHLPSGIYDQAAVDRLASSLRSPYRGIPAAGAYEQYRRKVEGDKPETDRA